RQVERYARGEFACKRPDIFSSSNNGGAEAQLGHVAGRAPAQIGTLQAETYATAVGKVYAALARSGVRYVVTITKDPTRNGALRPLRETTAALLEAAGYRVVAWRRAWLWHTERQVNELAGQGALFDEEETGASGKRRGRISFFRHLSLQKGGVAAQW